ncbi:TPA: transposase [Stenotrophomonas maltophilia]|nr:transposase [Stenotrophomonas maltophilia]
MPWKALLAQIEPHYLRPGRAVRPPCAMETILRIHLLQWYALSDPDMEEALHEIASMRLSPRLSGLDAIPDESTILNFRRPLERHRLAAKMLEVMDVDLARKDQSLRASSIVDAIYAPRTKNQTAVSTESAANRVNAQSPKDWVSIIPLNQLLRFASNTWFLNNESDIPSPNAVGGRITLTCTKP